ncbi:eukaryotic aspartyl protease [Phlyctema vagabunda]|uniref:Eukaryotic aspartyl protease n=1 Tax=Phlyctema vagabunda TaxID=108571 RepID=A0ABR4PWD9_9HELO
MLIIRGIIAVVALTNGASAFFPWNPTANHEGHSSTDVKLEGEIQVRASSQDLHTIKIVQRLPTNDLADELRIKRLAQRLTQKYSRNPTRVHAKDLENRGDIAKRTNTYSIATASKPTQTNSAGIDQDGTDYSYFAQVGLGSAKTPMYMLLDTGAGTTWVMGPSCKSDSCLVHNSFGAADSTTYKASNLAFSVSYGSGSVSGNLATDSLYLAGLTVSMTLGIAEVTSADFTDFPMDGILGLSQALGNTPNFIQTLVASKDLKSNLFGVDLHRASDGGANNGEINFGAPNTSKYKGSLSYSNVNTTTGGDWAIPMDDVGVDGSLAGIKGRLAYIDTGTSYIFGPPADIATFHKTITGSLSGDGITFSVPCSTTTSMEFVFSGVSYSVSPKDWVGNPLGDGRCISNIFGHEVVAGAWLLGDTFLKNVYSVFDIDGNRIGFAEKPASKTDTNTATSASSTGGPTPFTDTTSSTTEFPSKTLSSPHFIPVTSSSSTFITSSSSISIITSSFTSIITSSSFTSMTIPKSTLNTLSRYNSITKSVQTLPKTKSNNYTVVSTSSMSASPLASTTGAGASETGTASSNSLGLGGHETSNPSGTAATETAAASATNSAAPSSKGARQNVSLAGTLSVLAILLMSLI